MKFFPQLLFLFLFLFSSCLSGSEQDAQKQIREKYQAEEVRIHFPEEEINDSLRNVAEIIIINSPVLGKSNVVYEDGLAIAGLFFHSMKEREQHDGVRVIISNPSSGNHVSGFSKSYFYGKDLLRH